MESVLPPLERCRRDGRGRPASCLGQHHVASRSNRFLLEVRRVSVNVSPVQINSELVDQVRDIIKQSGLDPKRLELEVTEDVLIKDFDQTASMFSRLRALGIQVAMDDFGAGYTSMGNLRRLNFDRLKIDRIFTMDLPNHRRSSAIVRSMSCWRANSIWHVTVEGVEPTNSMRSARARRARSCRAICSAA